MLITFTILRSARGLIRGGSNYSYFESVVELWWAATTQKIVAYGIFFDPRDSVTIHTANRFGQIFGMLPV